MFYQVGLLPVTNNLLDNSSDIYLIVYGMITQQHGIRSIQNLFIPSNLIQILLKMKTL